jgi:transcriptional regulator with XRE-family HTH domain
MSKLADWLATDERRMEFAEEELIVDAAEEIWAAMAAAKVTKKDVADRLGKSKAFISQLLNGSRNMTLRTFADIAHCIGYRAKLSLQQQDSVALWKPLNDALLVQFDLRHLTIPPVAEPVTDADVARGNWNRTITGGQSDPVRRSG